MLKKNFIFFLLGVILVSCHFEKENEVWAKFPFAQSLEKLDSALVNVDSIGIIIGLACDGRNLVVTDPHSGKCYTLFDAKTGEYIDRFGTIGQGPEEIERAYPGYLSEGIFIICNDQTRRVQRYYMDSLRYGREDASPVRLTQYKLDNLYVSKLAALNDSTFFSAGLYQPKWQFCLFNKNNEVLSTGGDVYNASDSSFNAFTRMQSNQGYLVAHPKLKTRFAFSLLFSSNMDIVDVERGEIVLVKSLHWKDPMLTPTVMSVGGMTAYSADPSLDAPVGYLDLCASEKGIYALYSDEKFSESKRGSKDILFFDWNGNPVARYLLDVDAYYVAVDLEGENLYAAVRSEEGIWGISCYKLD